MLTTPTVVAFLFAVVFLVASILLVVNTLRDVPALAPWQPVIILLAVIWWTVPGVKKAVVDGVFYPNDSIVHEDAAREIAYLINGGEYREVRNYLGFGNEGYRIVLGVFYAFTNAPELTTYGIHGFLAFWGMLNLLRIVCIHTRAQQVPFWVIVLCLFSPSAVFWSSFNLKEGAMLWGLCMMCRLTLWGVDRQETGLLPMLGMLTAGFLRPHITIAYLAAIAIGIALRKRQIGVILVAGLGVMAGLMMLRTMAPAMFDRLAYEGIDATLTDKFDELAAGGGSAIRYASGKPIPVFSGFILLLLRPFPWEVSDATNLAAGVEVWTISSLCLLGWMRNAFRLKSADRPYLLTLIMALLALSFYFSYMYNMGLMVRQRVMVFPLMIPLAVIPALHSFGATVRHRMAAPGYRAIPRPGSRIHSAASHPFGKTGQQGPSILNHP